MIERTMLPERWQEAVGEEVDQPYFRELARFLSEEYRENTVFPPATDIFNAFQWTDYQEVKVVILGQDPYHGPNQAHGMSFSVRPGVPVPPSLRNMYKELEADLGCPAVDHGYLAPWAEEGVLLLNTVLTVREGEPKSHQKQGWERFTNRVIESLNEKESPVVFILWGADARKKAAMIDHHRHLILEAPHPSPLSAYRGFFGSRPFSEANAFLKKNGRGPVNWCLPDQPDG
ncbi:uracil-DNA glycosylase [Salisediminibacterium selenitireducens]|uniref:Uracil-DNA glycosylase n=1 Tax=Bacillus selenitireducens (strain ATCC 700615 / DSM 15326 / MLS10) TaxID=439292 RepID=D6XY87_BACIE|nr:uracil-DNA glycosylase [Salisediminibacterium selenitireducens]ADH98160.1 uracil-DNA glycosylase [[Bacillus] selenitireducens MLS10]